MTKPAQTNQSLAQGSPALHSTSVIPTKVGIHDNTCPKGTQNQPKPHKAHRSPVGGVVKTPRVLGTTPQTGADVTMASAQGSPALHSTSVIPTKVGIHDNTCPEGTQSNPCQNHNQSQQRPRRPGAGRGLVKSISNPSQKTAVQPAKTNQPTPVKPHYGVPGYPDHLTPHQAACKRAFDVIAATLLLIFFTPLLLATALLIRADGTGPALFRQLRGGYNGRPFLIYKFRSMRGAQPQHPDFEPQATPRDTRVTPLGRLLRRTSLDELPQLLNVIKGEMTLVGPRPHVPSHNNYYGSAITAYASRHRVRPGVTGWAQIHGLRGRTETLDKMIRRVEHDLWYINHASFALDLKILLQTPWSLLRHRDKAF